jgi:hypothetical protein
MTSLLKVFDEPQLEFYGGQALDHPRDGLTLFGPVDSHGISKPRHVRLGLIGTQAGIQAFSSFLSVLRKPILSDERYADVLWPHFPGFEEAFHSLLPDEANWHEIVDLRSLEGAALQGDPYARVFGVTALYLDAVRRMKRTDVVCDVLVLVVPDFVWTNCRPKSRVRAALGKSLSKSTVTLRRQMDDLFDGYSSDQYEYSLDFRRQIKARVMEFDVPIQIIRESTLGLSSPKFGERQLTPLSDRAWNIGTALYYKSGGKPWKLNGARDGVCYVGIAFKNTEDNSQNACCAAQMFLDDGDGVVFLGDEGKWYSEERGEYHLPKGTAKRLLEGILHTYGEQHGKPLREIFLHSQSSLNEEEFSGYQEACPKGAKLIGIRVAPDRSGVRLYRNGTRPVIRGSFWEISPRRGYLWGSGFKPRLRTYDGSEVPVPLDISIQHGESSIVQVARDILGLTKLNYNASKLGEFQPVTIRFSKEVGEILVTNRKSVKRHPNFKYYI